MSKIRIYEICFLIVLFLLEISAIKVFSTVPYLIPRLTLLLVMVFALANSFTATIWFSFASGFLMEIFSGAFFGAFIFAYALVGAMVYLLTRKFTAQDLGFYTAVFLVVLQTLFFGIWVYLFSRLAGFMNNGEYVAFRELFDLKLIWVLLVNILFFYPIRAIFKLLPK